MTTAKQQLKLFFATVLNYADKSAVQELFANLGYDTTNSVINADLCLQAYKEFGKEFGKPFAAIARKALESPKMEMSRRLYRRSKQKTTKATGDSKVSQWWNAKTNEQKDQYVQGWFDNIIKVLNVSTDMYSAINGNKNTQDQTQYISALDQYNENKARQQYEENSKNNTLKYALIAGGGVLLLVIIIVIAVVASKK